jgi:hypothetical protein
MQSRGAWLLSGIGLLLAILAGRLALRLARLSPRLARRLAGSALAVVALSAALGFLWSQAAQHDE